MVIIDGDKGEGGGQVLRTSLALAGILGEPVEIHNIRAGRSEPGLRPQHSTAVEAIEVITRGKVEGNKIGSTSLVFEPGNIEPGHYDFEIGTAGSTQLVLQTIYLPLAMAEDESRIKISGGTHVPWSPPFEHSDLVWRKAISRMGINLSLKLLSAGFYPQGGGRIDVKIKGKSKIKPISLTQRGKLKSLKTYGAVANLNDKIAERMIRCVSRTAKQVGIPAKSVKKDVIRPSCHRQGAYVFVQLDYGNTRYGSIGLGEPGKRAEVVAAEAWEDIEQYFHAVEPVGPYMADQLLLPLSVASGESEFVTTRITPHLITNAWVIEAFGAAKVEIDGNEGGPGTVKVKPV